MFDPSMMLPSVNERNAKTPSPYIIAKKNKRRKMTKNSRRMNRYQTNGHRTSRKRSLRTQALK